MFEYLSPGHELHEGPAVFMSDELHGQLLAGRQLVDAVVPPRGAAAGRGGGGGGRGSRREDREDGFGGFRRRSHVWRRSRGEMLLLMFISVYQ